MATVPAIRLADIVSVVFGSDTIKGVRSVNLTVAKGRMLPKLEEGNLYPTGVDNVGMPEVPVGVSIVFETELEAMIDLITANPQTLVVTYKALGGAANRIATISNAYFERTSYAQNNQDAGKPQVEGGAFSSDGTTLPLATSTAV